jgi:hypothetical protein
MIPLFLINLIPLPQENPLPDERSHLIAVEVVAVCYLIIQGVSWNFVNFVLARHFDFPDIEILFLSQPILALMIVEC